MGFVFGRKKVEKKWGKRLVGSGKWITFDAWNAL